MLLHRSCLIINIHVLLKKETRELFLSVFVVYWCQVIEVTSISIAFIYSFRTAYRFLLLLFKEILNKKIFIEVSVVQADFDTRGFFLLSPCRLKLISFIIEIGHVISLLEICNIPVSLWSLSYCRSKYIIIYVILIASWKTPEHEHLTR